MKQFAKHFLSVLLLLSPLSGYAASDSGCSIGCPTSSSSSSDSCTSSSSSCAGCPSITACSADCSVSSSSSAPCSATSSLPCQSCGSSLFLPRPQGLNSAAIFNPFYYSSDLYDTDASIYLGFRFNQTFDGNRIAKCLFGNNTLTFTGSAVGSRADTDLLADYFGLPTEYVGYVKFNPRIDDYIFDFGAQWEMGNWHECLEGLYVRMNASLVHTHWDLRPCAVDPVTTASSTLSNATFDPGYMACAAAQNDDSIRNALSGTYKFGQMQEEWNYGRFSFEHRSITRVANVDLVLGYDFLRCDSYHFGAFIKTVAPTGNRPNSQYVFEPIAGNGHHWELGGGIDAHFDFWQCDDQALSAYLTGSVTHLFKDRQWRSFDFQPSDIQDGCMSRYLLLKEFKSVAGVNTYTGRLIPGINFTTRKVQSSFDVMGDATLRFMYRNGGWVTAAGYNVYGRSTEKIGSPCCYCDPAENRPVGIKGTTDVCDVTTGGVDSTTQSNARIHAGGTDDATPTDETCFDLCFKGVPSQVIHKVFGSVDYQWKEHDCMPWLGVGAEGNFANNGKQDVCTPNTWGLWIRGGFSY